MVEGHNKITRVSYELSRIKLLLTSQGKEGLHKLQHYLIPQDRNVQRESLEKSTGCCTAQGQECSDTSSPNS